MRVQFSTAHCTTVTATDNWYCQRLLWKEQIMHAMKRSKVTYKVSHEYDGINYFEILIGAIAVT